MVTGPERAEPAPVSAASHCSLCSVARHELSTRPRPVARSDFTATAPVPISTRWCRSGSPAASASGGVRGGRPRVLYESATGPEDPLCASAAQTGTAYVELAQLLAGQLIEMEDAPAKAVRAGRRWAAALDSSPLKAGAPSPGEAMTTVAGLFEGLGFDPELVPEQDRILLHACPYVEVARGARPVVCGMHLGMLKATLERLDAPLEVTGFHPFVQQDPLLCLVTLAEKL